MMTLSKGRVAQTLCITSLLASTLNAQLEPYQQLGVSGVTTTLVKEDIDDIWIIMIPVIAAILGLLNVIFLGVTRIMSTKVPDDTKEHKALIKTAAIIKKGAMAFLIKEYMFLFVFVVIMACVLGGVTMDWATVVSFLVGAFLSALCGWIGMYIAVTANYRTTYAAEDPDNGLNNALKVAFASGASMGFGVVCSGILGLVILWAGYKGYTSEDTRYLAGFGFGASAIALFARVGGGIYTKAADVGADLVGKVESNLPEDDPRNPATIADNVGDNVGDVAGMGADLFESFVGGIIASIQLAPVFWETWISDESGTVFDTKQEVWITNAAALNDVRGLIAFPLWISAFGIVTACIGIYFVRTGANAEGGDDAKNELQERLLCTIRTGLFGTSFLATCATVGTAAYLFGTTPIMGKLYGCTLIGLVAGMIIGVWTEYATSFTFKPTQTIAKKGKMGAAPVVIQGIGIGMLSTMGPTIIIFAAIIACFELGSYYGIAIASVGMLSTLGITLATDAFGPVADNAGGLAEMAEMDERVRDTTDGLDALGNTTAATGKGFAIGSAVLSALALLSAYKKEAGINPDPSQCGDITTITLADLQQCAVGIDVSKSTVLAATIFGSCLPFIFAALTMMAVGRAATMMIDEVRRQIPLYNLLSDTDWQEPEYENCVKISTQASVLEMIIPGLLAIIAPLFMGTLLDGEALGGMLVGSIATGFCLAVYMANSGGAWDNAKKWVEAGQMRFKGKIVKKNDEDGVHAAVVAGDTIGDPFKDTSGPALNILMKLMTMISLVFAGPVFKGKQLYELWWVALIIGGCFMLLAVSLTCWMRSIGMGKMKAYVGDKQPVVANDATEMTGLVESGGQQSNSSANINV